MKKVKIGRDSNLCDIVINDSFISRVHAEITIINGQYVYHDVSSNGTNIGNQIIRNKKIVIAPGSPVLLSNKVPLPWDRIYNLLPLSNYQVNNMNTNVIQSASNQTNSSDYATNKQHPYNLKNAKDELTVGWGVFAFLIPIAGLIMYFAWKDQTPHRANQAVLVCIIGFVLNFILFFA